MVFQNLREKEEDEFRQIVCLRVEKFLFDFLAVFKGFLFQVDQRRAFELCDFYLREALRREFTVCVAFSRTMLYTSCAFNVLGAKSRARSEL